MSARLKKNFQLLKALENANPRTRRAIISTSPNHLILCICEIAMNILNGNVSLTTKDRARLKRYKSMLRMIADKRVSLDEKKKNLIQTGGLLPALLVPALTVVGSLIGELIRR